MLHLQKDQPLLCNIDAGCDCRPLLFEFLQMCSRPGQERLAILHLLVDGHALAAVSARFNAARNPSTSGPSVSPNMFNACCNFCTRSPASDFLMFVFTNGRCPDAPSKTLPTSSPLHSQSDHVAGIVRDAISLKGILQPWRFCQGSTRHRRHRRKPSAYFLALVEGPVPLPHPAGFRGLCPPRLPTGVLRGVRKTGGEMG